jgi:hypothetical protein
LVFGVRVRRLVAEPVVVEAAGAVEGGAAVADLPVDTAGCAADGLPRAWSCEARFRTPQGVQRFWDCWAGRYVF